MATIHSGKALVATICETKEKSLFRYQSKRLLATVREDRDIRRRRRQRTYIRHAENHKLHTGLYLGRDMKVSSQMTRFLMTSLIDSTTSNQPADPYLEMNEAIN